MSIVTTTLPLDPSYSGASLRIQYYEYDSVNDERDAIGSPISDGIFELAGGEGLFVLALDIPDALEIGWADVYVNGAPGVILASIPIGADEDMQAVVLAALTEYDAATGTDVNCSGNGKIEFPYTLTAEVTHQPIPGATVRITTDSGGLNTIWTGTTNILGVARNLCGDLPRLMPGTYFFWRTYPTNAFYFVNPDTEIVTLS